jgi:hypothetical protein
MLRPCFIKRSQTIVRIIEHSRLQGRCKRVQTIVQHRVSTFALKKLRMVYKNSECGNSKLDGCVVYTERFNLNVRCQTIAPSSQTLSPLQKAGLELISMFQGRDVVFAIDLTQSVRLNDEGRLRLRQIIQDSLETGDSVYIVPFASTVNPLKSNADLIATATAIPFQGRSEDVDRILQAVPLQANVTQQYTDIQKAELVIYKQLAQRNQCRLADGQGIKAQSVVWLTDAPLLTKPGIPSKIWVETPASSPFRQQNSQPSLERQGWIDALPLLKRSQAIDNYKLSVVDIPPTVQEFCTPAPGGRETCLVNAYLIQQLWLPGLLSAGALAGATALGVLTFKYWQSLKRAWRLKISSDDDSEPQIRHLHNQQRLGIGSDIECPGYDIRGYIRRERNQLFLEPIAVDEFPIYYQNRQVTQRQLLQGQHIRLNCPHRSRDFELTIQVNA